MNNNLRNQILAVLPKLETALLGSEEKDEVKVEGISIKTDQAQTMYNNFVGFINEGQNISWRCIPFALISASPEYNKIQKYLNVERLKDEEEGER